MDDAKLSAVFNLEANAPMSTQNDSTADEVMCQCSGTTRAEIQKYFERGMDMEQISQWTGALSGCGGCEWDIADFLKCLSAQRENGA